MAERQLLPNPEAPRIEFLGEGRIGIVGDLTFDTVGDLLASKPDAAHGLEKTILDLAKVTRTDSAGLALVVEWLIRARRGNARIEIINMPEQMRSIARMSKFDQVLLADGG